MTKRKKATPSEVFRRSDIDADAIRVIEQLRKHGYEAYLVGGCVRDLYLKRKPKDFDVATNATPEQIRRTFRNSRIIGRRFTIVHVYYGSKIIETATFRQPPKSSGDEDDNLIKQDNNWGTLEDDAKRRDFTINGLFYDIKKNKVVDSVGGLADLERGVIRSIGDPKLRFEEDPVRMMRAIKFAARLDFVINEEEWSAIASTAGDIARCSKARVLEEIYKLLRSGSAHRSFALLQVSGLLEHLWPEYIQCFRGLGDLSRDCGAQGEGEASYRFWQHLASLDHFVFDTKQQPSNGLMLALLFAPLIPESLFLENSGNFAQAIEDLMKGPCVALGVARRDRELAEDIFESFRRIQSAAPSQRRRRQLVQRRCFQDVLCFLGLTMPHRAAMSGEAAELAAWQAMAASRDDLCRRQRSGKDRPLSESPRNRTRRSRRNGRSRRARGG